MKNYIGLRTLKTGIAICISVIVSNLLNLEYPFFVCMTALISMDKTVLSSIKMGRNRVFGTFLGASIGFCFHHIAPGNPILCGIGIMLLIVILNKLKMPGAIGIGGIVFSAMMVHLGTKDPFLYGMHRTLDSFVGATVTLFVNALILPYYNLDRLHDKINDYHQLLTDTYISFTNGNQMNLKPIISKAKDIDFYLDLYLNEIMSSKKKAEVLEACARYTLLKETSDELEIVTKTNDDAHVQNYHLQKALKTLNTFNEYENKPIIH